MIDKVREFAREAVDSAPMLQGTVTSYDLECYYKDRLSEASVIILALLDVVECLREQIYYSCSACEDNQKDAMEALTTADERIGKILGEDDE